jgi:DnaJ-class molecular chaperone
MRTPTAKELAFTNLCYDDENWMCPRCGSVEADLYIDDDEGSTIRRGQRVRCETCKWEGTAGQVVDAAKSRRSLVKCEHCGGTGYVASEAS